MKHIPTILYKLFKILFRPLFVIADFSLRLLRLIPGYRKLPLALQKGLAVVLTITTLFSSTTGLFLFNPFVKKTQAAWFNDNWSYRTEYTTTNTGAADSYKKVNR